MKRSNEAINKKVTFSEKSNDETTTKSMSQSKTGDEFPQSNVISGLVTVSNDKPALHPFYADVLYKMSKKIAQLTKVIYFLNNKYELHEKEIAYRDQIHSDKIERIQSEKDDTIARLKEELSAAKIHHEDSKTTFKVGSDTLRLEYEKKADHLSSIFNEEKEHLRQQYTNEIIQLNMIADQKFKAYQEELAKVRADAAKKEIEAKDRFEKMMESQKVIHFALTDEMQQLEQKKLKELKHAEELYRNQMLEKSESHIKELSAYKLKLSEMEKTMSERGISWNHQFKELESHYRDELKRIREELQDQRKKVKDTEDALAARDVLLQEAKMDLRVKLNLIGNLEDQLASANQMEHDLSIKIKAMQSNFLAFESQKAELHEYNNSLKLRLEKQNSQIDALKASIAIHENQLRSNVERERKLQDDLSKSALVNANLAAEIEKLKQDFIKKTEEIKVQYEKEVKDKIQMIKQKSNSDLAESMKSQEQTYQSKVDSHTLDMKKLQSDHEEEIKTMTRRIQEIENKSSKDVSSLEDLLQVTKDALQRESDRAEKLLKETSENCKEIERLNLVVKALDSRCSKLELEKTTTQSKLKDDIVQLEADYKDQLLNQKDRIESEWKRKFSQNTEDLVQEYEVRQQEINNSMIELKFRYEEEITKTLQERNEWQDKYTRAMGDLEHSQMRNEEKASEIERLIKSIADLRVSFTQEKEKMIEEHKKSVARLNDEKESMVKAAIHEREEAMDALMKSKEDEIAAKTKAFTEHTISLNGEIRKLEEDIRKFDVERDEWKINQTKLIETTLAEANRVFDLERQKLQSEINKLHIDGQAKDDQIFKISGELAKLKEDGKEYVNKIKMLGQEIQKLNTTIQGKDADILKGAEKLRNRELEFQGEIVEIQKRFDESMSDLELKHREALKNAQKDGNDVMENMISEFEQARSKLKDKIATLQEDLKLLQERYENRPSREDDLEMIKSLKSDSEFKKKQILTLTNEVNILRLEISNREENYNKIFNTRPQIGVMQTIGLTNNFADKMQKRRASEYELRQQQFNLLSKLPPLKSSNSVRSIRRGGSGKSESVDAFLEQRMMQDEQ